MKARAKAGGQRRWRAEWGGVAGSVVASSRGESRTLANSSNSAGPKGRTFTLHGMHLSSCASAGVGDRL